MSDLDDPEEYEQIDDLDGILDSLANELFQTNLFSVGQRAGLENVLNQVTSQNRAVFASIDALAHACNQTPGVSQMCENVKLQVQTMVSVFDTCVTSINSAAEEMRKVARRMVIEKNTRDRQDEQEVGLSQ